MNAFIRLNYKHSMDVATLVQRMKNGILATYRKIVIKCIKLMIDTQLCNLISIDGQCIVIYLD